MSRLDHLRSLARRLEADPLPAPGVARPRRIAAAVAVGLAAGTFCGLALARPGPGPDFQVFWEHARTLVAGGNPYAHPAVVGPGRVAPLLYPLPAAMLVAPFARLPMPLAGALFLGFSSALLAYAATRDGWHRLLLFLSGPFIVAATLGQWSPLVTAGALLPWLGGVAAVKPNVGLAVFAHRPSWRAVAGGLLLLALSLAIVPSWPRDWLRVVRAGDAIYHAPVASAAGALLLLALLRWRNPGARLLVVLACVPQMLFFYDQLPLWLVARTWRESVFLTLASLCAWLGWVSTLRPGTTTNEFIPAAQPWVLFGVFLPALLVVLRQRPGPGVEATASGTRAAPGETQSHPAAATPASDAASPAA
ncbi:MAG: hypothetical protein ACJ79S_04195 [Gemmatimonadaceae bacterium]